uniref:Prostaglandin E synthase 3 n=1 Tax=Xenopus tropicalis TaxID=8364 RepID=A0A803JDK4_XENTR
MSAAWICVGSVLVRVLQPETAAERPVRHRSSVWPVRPACLPYAYGCRHVCKQHTAPSFVSPWHSASVLPAAPSAHTRYTEACPWHGYPSCGSTATISRHPASAKWYDRRDYVFVEFCVEDSKEVKTDFDKNKLTFSCLGGADNVKYLNEVELFQSIDPNESKHKRTDRSVLCCLRKGESGQSWPRITKEKAKLNWLSVDFNNWKDWEDDSDEDMSNFDRFSEMMNNMGGDEDVDLPEVDGADDDSPDSDDEKMPDLE